VRTLADVAETTGLRVVGVLPRVSAMRNKPVEALSNRRVGPAIRNLRTQLERHVERDSDDGRGLVIAFTSSSEGEGKSSIAAVYAVASARMQQRVLLIDGDLLRPDVAELFRIAPKPGVAQVLKGAQSVDAMQYLRDPGVPNLSVMPTSRDPDGGDLVARNMGDLLRWASSAFDLVVVDSPPVLGNDIGPTIATLADAVVFVLRRGTRGSLADDAVGVLRTLEANVVGAVANAVPPSDAAYYG
jgi:Mrp family chromosome partitioning ATPase